MKRICMLALLLIHTSLYAQNSALTDNEIRVLTVENSRNLYKQTTGGTCACQYDLQSNGERCGEESAWSKRIIGKPICYTYEVTPEMILAYRQGLAPAQPITAISPPLSTGLTAQNISRGVFLHQGVSYHPLSSGCNVVTEDMPLNTLQVTWHRSSLGHYTEAILFQLPDGSQCLAMPIRMTYF